MISIGTDCSGIEAPIQALKNLGIKFSHKWSCEIDKYAQESLLANYNPELLFTDIKQKRILPNIDIYVCGFPCQSFSYAGHRKGTADPRGTIFYDCYSVIKNKLPKVFILENVKGLLTINNGETWKTILDHLNSLGKYNVYHKILNTRDYGIPQNRERIFIVGILKSFEKTQFKFPEPCKMKNIKHFSDEYILKRKIVDDKKVYKTARKSYNKSKAVFIDLDWVNIVSPNSYTTYCSTIATGSNFWYKPTNRKASIKELLSLQGFPRKFKQVVSNTQMIKQIGNSMSVNVLEKLFIQIFKVNNKWRLTNTN